MNLSAKEQEVLSGIAQQIAAKCITAGITNPTKYQIDAMLVSCCRRNIALAGGMAYGAKWATPMLEAMAIDVYRDVHMQELVERTR